METDNAQEVWETTTGGTFWVHVKDPRQPGGWAQKRFGGRGSKKITITVEEREFNQELVSEDYQQHDPFTNGLLVRVSPKVVERSEYELTDEDLLKVLAWEDDDKFEAYLRAVESEVIVRRFLALAGKNASKWRYDQIQQFVDVKYHIGKTSKVAKEIFEDDAKYADADL